MESSFDFNSSSTNRFGAKSRNMFFVRHTAAPRHLKTIFGIDGITICSMKDNDYKLPREIRNRIDSMFTKASSNNYRSVNNIDNMSNQPTNQAPEHITDPKFKLTFNTDYNKDLLNSYQKYLKPKHVKERIFPAIKHFTAVNTLGMDTQNWKFELNNLGKMIGIMTADEIRKETNRLAELRKKNHISNEIESNNLTRSFMMPNKHFTSINLKSSQQNLNDLDISIQFDEKKVSTSRPNTKSHSGKCKKSKYILCDDQNDREMWLLKILSQILDTDSLLDVQTWLVSADKEEKNAMKDLITKALEGLNQSGRVDLNQLVINPNDKQTQVDFEKTNHSLNKLVVNKTINSNALLNETDSKANYEKTNTNNLNLVDHKIKTSLTIDPKNFSIPLNPRLSADFFKMINKKNMSLHKSNTCLNLKSFKEKETNSNFNDTDLQFPTRTEKSYVITTASNHKKGHQSDLEKPKKVVDVLSLDLIIK